MAIITDELPLGQVTHGLLNFCFSSTLGQVITHFANSPPKIMILNNFYYIRCSKTALPFTGHAVKSLVNICSLYQHIVELEQKFKKFLKVRIKVELFIVY